MSFWAPERAASFFSALAISFVSCLFVFTGAAQEWRRKWKSAVGVESLEPKPCAHARFLKGRGCLYIYIYIYIYQAEQGSFPFGT